MADKKRPTLASRNETIYRKALSVAKGVMSGRLTVKDANSQLRSLHREERDLDRRADQSVPSRSRKTAHPPKTKRD